MAKKTKVKKTNNDRKQITRNITKTGVNSGTLEKYAVSVPLVVTVHLLYCLILQKMSLTCRESCTPHT